MQNSDQNYNVKGSIDPAEFEEINLNVFKLVVNEFSVNLNNF